MTKIAVTMATLKSYNHIVGDVERGVEVFRRGGIEWVMRETEEYYARVPHKDGFKSVVITFSKDGQDIDQHYCYCSCENNEPPICRHVVAAVLTIQGGAIESSMMPGKSASAKTIVTDRSTAKAIGSGDLEVLATPMMVALMEEAACNCIINELRPGQTSVGTQINVDHTAASPLNEEITATAIIEHVFGRRIEFKVTASDSRGEIGSGIHSRIIVDVERFLERSLKGRL